MQRRRKHVKRGHHRPFHSVLQLSGKSDLSHLQNNVIDVNLKFLLACQVGKLRDGSLNVVGHGIVSAALVHLVILTFGDRQAKLSGDLYDER